MWLFYYNEDDYLAVDNTLMDDHCHRRHLSSSRPTCLTPITQSQIADDRFLLQTINIFFTENTKQNCSRRMYFAADSINILTDDEFIQFSFSFLNNWEVECVPHYSFKSKKETWKQTKSSIRKHTFIRKQTTVAFWQQTTIRKQTLIRKQTTIRKQTAIQRQTNVTKSRSEKMQINHYMYFFRTDWLK